MSTATDILEASAVAIVDNSTTEGREAETGPGPRVPRTVACCFVRFLMS